MPDVKTGQVIENGGKQFFDIRERERESQSQRRDGGDANKHTYLNNPQNYPMYMRENRIAISRIEKCDKKQGEREITY